MECLYEKNLKELGIGLGLIGIAFGAPMGIEGKLLFLFSSACFLLIATIRTIIYFMNRGKF
jgi:hypothetical protein